MRLSSNIAFKNLERASQVEYESATVEGVTRKTILLLLLTIASALGSIYILGLFNSLMYYSIALIAEIILVFLVCFVPSLAKALSIPYAICEGFLIGTVGSILEFALPGVGLAITGLAGIITMIIFLVGLILYSLNIFKVTNKFRRTFFISIIAFSLSMFAFFIFSLMIPNLSIPFGLFLVIDVIYVLISSIYCVFQIDNANRIVSNGIDKTYEWYASVGILLSIIWLFWDILELLLRLVLYSRRND